MSNQDEDYSTSNKDDFAASVKSALPAYEFFDNSLTFNYSYTIGPEAFIQVSAAPETAGVSETFDLQETEQRNQISFSATPDLPEEALTAAVTSPETTRAASDMLSVADADWKPLLTTAHSPVQQKSAAPAAQFTATAVHTSLAHAATARSANEAPIADTETAQFGADFDFNSALASIFWRIDIDKNNRVNRLELTQAVEESWFGGYAGKLAVLLLANYDRIIQMRPDSSYFFDLGLTVEEIISFPPFSGMVKPVRRSLSSTYRTKSERSKDTSFLKSSLFRR